MDEESHYCSPVYRSRWIAGTSGPDLPFPCLAHCLAYFLYTHWDTSYSCPGHCLPLHRSLSVSLTGTLPTPAGSQSTTSWVTFCLIHGTLPIPVRVTVYNHLGHFLCHSLGHFLFLPGSLSQTTWVTFCITHETLPILAWVTVYNNLGHFLCHSLEHFLLLLGHSLQPPWSLSGSLTWALPIPTRVTVSNHLGHYLKSHGSLPVSLTGTLPIPARVTVYSHLGHFLCHSLDTSCSCPGHCLPLHRSLSTHASVSLSSTALVTFCVIYWDTSYFLSGGHCLTLLCSYCLGPFLFRLGHCLPLPGSLSFSAWFSLPRSLSSHAWAFLPLSGSLSIPASITATVCVPGSLPGHCQGYCLGHWLSYLGIYLGHCLGRWLFLPRFLPGHCLGSLLWQVAWAIA